MAAKGQRTLDTVFAASGGRLVKSFQLSKGSSAAGAAQAGPAFNVAANAPHTTINIHIGAPPPPVVWDNVGFHNSPAVKATMEGHGILARPLPPNCTDILQPMDLVRRCCLS
jgi:hypothetical protein